MIAWLEPFRANEQADDYRNLYLGARFADFLECDRPLGPVLIAPAQRHLS
jgi:hypothetical protein